MKSNKAKAYSISLCLVIFSTSGLVAQTSLEENNNTPLGSQKLDSEVAKNVERKPSKNDKDKDTAGSEVARSDEAEEIYILSDFEVTEEQDRGYHSAHALSGTRTNALIKDTPMTISVLNDQLISDLGLTELSNLSEVMAGAESSEWGAFSGTSTRSLQIRGLTSRSQLFDFMPRTLSGEGYNVGRREVARGTNTMVFGQSDPGGKVNMIPKRAEFFNDKKKLDLTLGEYVERSTVDVNHQINDQFAARVMAVSSLKTSSMPGKEKDYKAATLALSYRPTNKTSLQLHIEGVELDTKNPLDRYQDETGIYGRTGIPRNLYFYPEIVDYMPEALKQSIYNYRELTNFPTGSYHIHRGDTNTSDVSANLTNETNINNEADLRNFISGLNYKNITRFQLAERIGSESRGQCAIFNVSHSFSENLQARLAFFGQQTKGSRDFRSGKVRYHLGANGQNNNDVNEPYLRMQWTRNDNSGEAYAIRGTLSWDFELYKTKHQWLFGTDLNYDVSDLAKSVQAIQHEDGVFANGKTWSSSHTAYDYFGLNVNPSILKGVEFNETVDLNFVTMPSLTILNSFNSKGSPLLMLLEKTEESEHKNAAGWTALQSRFMGGRLNTLMGVRLDYTETEMTVTDYKKSQGGYDHDRWDPTSPSYDPNFAKLGGGTPNRSIYRTASPSLGGVFWLTEHLGLTGSWSKSIQAPNAGKQTIEGESLDPEIGEGLEGGIRFEMLEGKLNGELIAYSIIKENESSNIGIDWQIMEILYPYSENPNLWIDSETFDPIGDVVPGTSLKAKGLEATLNYNPSPALSLRFAYNAGKTSRDKVPLGIAEGEEIAFTSRHSASLSGRYSFRDGPIKGAYLGFNQQFRYQPLLGTFYEDIGDTRTSNSDWDATQTRFGKLDGSPDYIPIWVPDTPGTAPGDGPGYYEQPRRHEVRGDDEWLTTLFVGWRGQFKKGRNQPRCSLQLNVTNLFDNDAPTRNARYIEGRTYFVKGTVEF